MQDNNSEPPKGELLVYQGQGLDSPVQVRLEGETVWLNQKLMAELYGVAVPTINEHISNIFDDEELRPEATIRKFRIVQTEGNRQVGRLIEENSIYPPGNPSETLLCRSPVGCFTGQGPRQIRLRRKAIRFSLLSFSSSEKLLCFFIFISCHFVCFACLVNPWPVKSSSI